METVNSRTDHKKVLMQTTNCFSLLKKKTYFFCCKNAKWPLIYKIFHVIIRTLNVQSANMNALDQCCPTKFATNKCGNRVFFATFVRDRINCLFELEI